MFETVTCNLCLNVTLNSLLSITSPMLYYLFYYCVLCANKAKLVNLFRLLNSSLYGHGKLAKCYSFLSSLSWRPSSCITRSGRGLDLFLYVTTTLVETANSLKLAPKQIKLWADWDIFLHWASFVWRSHSINTKALLVKLHASLA